MKIYADQVLHGYENGHQLLEASCKLNIDDRKRIDELSDLNGTTDENRYIDYYTGYPVAGGTKYVIAKTWYAYEKKRPGCAWTHSIIFNIEDFAKLTDLSVFFDTFQRPKEDLEWSYTNSIAFDIEERKKVLDVERNRLEYLIYTIFASSDPKFVIVQEEGYVKELFQVLNIMPYGILKTFTFSTMSYSNRRYGNQPFQYQMISERDSYLFLGRYKDICVCEDISKIKKYPYWVEGYANLILCNSLEDLNRFIIQYDEYAWSLTYYNCFVRLFFAIMNDKMTLRDFFDAIELVAPNIKKELWQKSVDLIVDGIFFDNYFERQVYEILEMFDIEKFILNANRKKKMEDKIIRNSPEKLYPILKKYIAGNVTDNERQEIENIIMKLKAENLKIVSQMDENICVVLIRMNNEMLLAKEIWEQSRDFQRTLIYCCDSRLSDEKLSNLLKIIIYYGTQNIAMDLYNVFGTKVIRLFYYVMGQDIKLDNNKLHDWTYVLLKDQKLLVNELKKVSSREQRKYLFLQLDFNSNDLLDGVDGHIWEKIYCDIFEDETRNDIRGQLSIKFFKIIFGSSNHFSEEFVKNVVGEVYQQLEKNQLSFDDWMQIEYLLPSVDVQYSWDKCLRVRKALKQKGYKLY